MVLIEKLANKMEVDEKTGCWNWAGGVKPTL